MWTSSNQDSLRPLSPNPITLHMYQFLRNTTILMAKVIFTTVDEFNCLGGCAISFQSMVFRTYWSYRCLEQLIILFMFLCDHVYNKCPFPGLAIKSVLFAICTLERVSLGDIHSSAFPSLFPITVKTSPPHGIRHARITAMVLLV